jgi:hypothetical protein
MENNSKHSTQTKISTYVSISNDDQSAAHVDVAPPNETLSNVWLKKRGSYKKFKETKFWMGRKAQGEEKGTKHNFDAGIIIQFHIYTHMYPNFWTLFSCKAQEVKEEASNGKG